MTEKLRWFEPSDTEQVMSLYAGEDQWFEKIGVTRDFILISSQRLDFRFLVAEEEGKIVGFTGCLYFEAVGRAEIGPLEVDAEHRRKGVGEALIKGMTEFLKEKKIRRVAAKVKADNRAAQQFFIKQGFRIESCLRDYTQEHESIIGLVTFI